MIKADFYRIALVVLLFTLFGIKGFTQISPGELTKAHASLEGMSNCVKCHVLGETVSNEKCLDCHKEIGTLIKNNKGYHSSPEVKGKNCFACHNEHHGRNFDITRYNEEGFDHKLTGYELLGKHKEVACNDCHKPEFIKDKISQKTQGHTHLGLRTDCLSCHADYHNGALGTDCTKCHNFDRFKTPSGFDHNKTNFPLVGAHSRTDCIKCHKKEIQNGVTSQKFKGIKSNACTDCHDDEHDGKFGNDCLQCHNQESFHSVKNMDHFDHNKTNYPLTGLHQKVDCKKCHKQSYTAHVKHNLCSDCHSDYHKGQFKQNGKAPDCTECHTVEGFTPSLFSIERHDQADFKLEGSHIATPCFACHLKTEHWEFRGVGKKCVDCHEDIHKDLINQSFYPEQHCESCHSVNSWDEVKFDHSLTSFVLEGKHAEQTCRKCHFKEEDGGKFDQKFSSLDKKCETCHADIHNAQFKEKYQNDCTSCHGFADWKAEKFDHDSTRFKLEGGHKDVACAKCHQNTEENNVTFIKYTYEDVKCVNCHSQ